MSKRGTISMKNQKSWVLLTLAVVLGAISFPIYRARADGDSQFQFNITTAASGAPAASSLAEDGSKISFRGTGSFKPDDPEEVTGEGTWETRDNKGNVTGSGSWQPTRLVKWDLGPGAIPNPAIKGGLAFFQITYSDGARGILGVSCFLPGAPPSVSEGIVASKDFILYGGHVHAGPTFFRVLSENEN
jgi:hypothetical protein